MALVDPKEFVGGGDGSASSIRYCGSGVKTLIPVGYEHREINGKPVVDIRYVCIHDHEESGDEGSLATDTFWLNTQSLWRVGQWANAMGRTEPFDPDDGDDLSRVLAIGPVVATIRIEKKNEYENQRFDKGCYKKHSMEVDPTNGQISLSEDQTGWIRQAEKSWSGYLKWRSDNPRSLGGQVTPPSNAPPPAQNIPSDEIPF